jgi:hypothetical protein
VTVATVDLFRWWRSEAGVSLKVDDALYRGDEWVALFLRLVSEHLAGSHPRSGGLPVQLQPDRDALVVTGPAADEGLRVKRATYRDLLLFHPGLHPEVEAAVAAAIAGAAAECARRGDASGERLRQQGRPLLLAEPSLLLHPTVAQGIAELGLTGLPPLGVSGIIEVCWAKKRYVLAARRTDRVAVNPGCLGPPVDGGFDEASHRGVIPWEALQQELRLELPSMIDRDSWKPFGTLLPPAVPTYVGGQPTRRCGVNVVFRAEINEDPRQVLQRGTSKMEVVELLLIEAPADGVPTREPVVLGERGGRLARVENPPPFSEVLAAALAELQIIAASGDPTASPDPHRSSRRTSEARPMSQIPSTVPNLTLEDTWAANLIQRHARLDRVLNQGRLSELAEQDPMTMATLAPLFDAVREYEFVRRTGQVKASDDARLFEAVVYRISRYLFANDETRAIAAHNLLLNPDVEKKPDAQQAPEAEQAPGTEPRIDVEQVIELEQKNGAEKDEGAGESSEGDGAQNLNPIGTAYTERLRAVKGADHDLDPTGVWREVVSEQLDVLNREEATQEYSEVGLRARLMCFCAALWSLEAKRSPDAASIALNDEFRRSLAGDVIALFFRARALLVSRVTSAAQTQLGLQFVTTALATFERNPGMHHTRAIFLLRQSSLTESRKETITCLTQALASVETALQWDAEYPAFYSTRAKIKYRLGDQAGALVDIRAAIELGRYDASSAAVRRDVEEWEATLDIWQLTPVGSVDG